MAQPNDLSRSLIPLFQESTLIVVVDMSYRPSSLLGLFHGSRATC
jgi:hypothetical protein